MLTLRDKLSHLDYRTACKLLGPDGDGCIIRGGKYDIDIGDQVQLGNRIFRLSLHDAFVIIEHAPEASEYLRFSCSECTAACEHLGAAFS